MEEMTIAQQQATLRALAREQGNLYLACYAEAQRVVEEMASIDEQMAGEDGGGHVEPPDAEKDFVEEEGEEGEETADESNLVLEITTTLFHGLNDRLKGLMSVVPPPTATAAPPPLPDFSPATAPRRRMSVGGSQEIMKRNDGKP